MGFLKQNLVQIAKRKERYRSMQEKKEPGELARGSEEPPVVSVSLGPSGPLGQYFSSLYARLTNTLASIVVC